MGFRTTQRNHRVKGIPDLSTESWSTMDIRPLNEIQDGYDSRPLNGITDYKGFQTTQRNPNRVGNRTTQRNPSGNPVPDHSTKSSGRPTTIIYNGLKKRDKSQVTQFNKSSTK
ncbi:hypothetical protein ACFX12_001285 [Malus domestica]